MGQDYWLNDFVLYDKIVLGNYIKLETEIIIGSSS